MNAPFVVSEGWKSAFPGAHAGLLIVRNVTNPPVHAQLEARKRALEQELRGRFAGADRKAIEALPAIEVYNAYYKRFKKTYHVQGQLESIALKGRDIPGVAGLVEAMFMAEVKDQLLTAGHDLDRLRLPLTLNVSDGTESFVTMRGEEQALKPGDMFIADQEGIISNIIYGPDQRTRITEVTTAAAFTVYAPGGISPQAVREHLQDILGYVQIVSPDARVEALEVFGAQDS